MKAGFSRVAAIFVAISVAILAAPPPALGEDASRRFVWADGPVQSQAISVALQGQSCDREIDPNWSYANILGLDVRISITNSGTAVATFDPAQTALSAFGRSHRPHRSDVAATMLPGASRTFVVYFLVRDDDLACNVPMALSFDRALGLDGVPVTVRPISFLASNDHI